MVIDAFRVYGWYQVESEPAKRFDEVFLTESYEKATKMAIEYVSKQENLAKVKYIFGAAKLNPHQ